MIYFDFFRMKFKDLGEETIERQCFLKAGTDKVRPSVVIRCCRNKREWQSQTIAYSRYQLKVLVEDQLICRECARFAVCVLDVETNVPGVDHIDELRKLYIHPTNMSVTSWRDRAAYGPWIFNRGDEYDAFGRSVHKW